MAKKNVEEEQVVESTKSEDKKVELLQTIKETGVGLKLPDGNVIDVSELDIGMVQWMKWVTETLNKVNESVGY